MSAIPPAPRELRFARSVSSDRSEEENVAAAPSARCQRAESPKQRLPLRHYRLYGLRIVCDFELPTDPVAQSDADDEVDYFVSTLTSAQDPLTAPTVLFRSPEIGTEGEPQLLIYRDDATGVTRWQWCDGVTIDVDGRCIDVFCPPEEALSGVAHTVIGQVLAFLLRGRGYPLLHGSALAVGQDAFAILGPSGAGKSTLATALALRGYRLLTDDVVALVEADALWNALTGYGGSRLWPDSAEMLLGKAAAIPLMLERTAYWTGFDKRYLRLRMASEAKATSRAPLRHIFVLQGREATGPVLERLSGAAAVAALDRNAYQLMLRGGEESRRDLAVFAALARQATVWRVVPGDDLAFIDALAAAVEERLSEQ